MAKIAARSSKRFSKLRRLNLTRRLEKERSQDECLEEAEIVSRENSRGKRLEAPCGTIYGEHGTFAEKSVYSHEQQQLV